MTTPALDHQALLDWSEVVREHAQYLVELWNADDELSSLSMVAAEGRITGPRADLARALAGLDRVTCAPPVLPSHDLESTAAGQRWPCPRCASEAVDRAATGERRCHQCGLGADAFPEE